MDLFFYEPKGPWTQVQGLASGSVVAPASQGGPPDHRNIFRIVYYIEKQKSNIIREK